MAVECLGGGPEVVAAATRAIVALAEGNSENRKVMQVRRGWLGACEYRPG